MKVERYISSDGKSPFEDWFNDLEPKTRARVRARIKRIELTDNLGEYKRLGEINELKFKFAGGLRVYFGMKGKTFILLLCGGNKEDNQMILIRP
jgi:putative addiction module killer protein